MYPPPGLWTRPNFHAAKVHGDGDCPAEKVERGLGKDLLQRPAFFLGSQPLVVSVSRVGVEESVSLMPFVSAEKTVGEVIQWP